jgi:hypothetical protein
MYNIVTWGSIFNHWRLSCMCWTSKTAAIIFTLCYIWKGDSYWNKSWMVSEVSRSKNDVERCWLNWLNKNGSMLFQVWCLISHQIRFIRVQPTINASVTGIGHHYKGKLSLVTHNITCIVCVCQNQRTFLSQGKTFPAPFLKMVHKI